MLCTVMWDSYATGERAEVREALETLLASDSDWSRKGVYAYWDADSHELLYLGLAADLPSRFAQHNGLKAHGGGNKKKEIDDHFANAKQLGLAVIVQGAAVDMQDAVASINPPLATPADEMVAVGEGQLIEMHRLVTGKRPPWNKTGGSKLGASFATPAPALLDVLAARRESLFAARRTIRDLTGDGRARQFEQALHEARLGAVMDAHGVGLNPASLGDGGEETVEKIRRGLMLSGGHLLQELDANDDEIVSWLRRIGDPSHAREQADQALVMLDSVSAAVPPGPDAVVADLLRLVFDGQAAPGRLEAVAAIFASDYLSERPNLRAGRLRSALEGGSP